MARQRAKDLEDWAVALELQSHLEDLVSILTWVTSRKRKHLRRKRPRMMKKQDCVLQNYPVAVAM